jgi:hypothetical protein
MGVVIAAALIAAMIIAPWTKHRDVVVETSPVQVDTTSAGAAAPALPRDPAPVVSARSVAPTPAAIAECNRYAATWIGVTGKSVDDLDETKKSDERFRRAYAICMRSLGYAG